MDTSRYQCYTNPPQCVSIVFDGGDPEGKVLEEALIRSFGEKYVMTEALVPPAHHVLHLLPGGTQELTR